MPLVTYNKRTGIIYTILDDDQNALSYFRDYDVDFKATLGILQVSSLPLDYLQYKIINGQLMEMTEEEKQESYALGHLLTDDERILRQIEKKAGDQKKARQTIETLNLWKEIYGDD